MKLKFSKPKKVKKTPFKRKLDALFSKEVRSIGHCQAEGRVPCKCGGALQCCHIVGRTNYRLRWDRMNVLCLCAGHHRWFHSHVFEFIEFVISYYPEQYDYIQKHKNEQQKMTVKSYKEKISSFT